MSYFGSPATFHVFSNSVATSPLYLILYCYNLCCGDELFGAGVTAKPLDQLRLSKKNFFLAVRPLCTPWACKYIISGAGVVSGTPHPAVKNISKFLDI